MNVQRKRILAGLLVGVLAALCGYNVVDHGVFNLRAVEIILLGIIIIWVITLETKK